MHDAAGLRNLITEYGQLQTLSGAQQTPQARGIRFNEFIAEMLRCWGIDAEVSTATTGAGEIDVVFALDGDRYLIEAKWEKDKTDAGPIAKLEKRLKQRLRGPIGISLSMAGFTRDAVQGIDKGSQLEILLFDRSHFEAMLSGLVPPQELLKLAHDRAAFRGKAYSLLLDLLTPRRNAPAVSYGCPSELAGALLSDATEGISARVLFTMASSSQLGIASGGVGTLLVTHQDGIAEVDFVRQKAQWKVPVRGCHRNPLRRNDGSIVFARQYGIGRFMNDELTIIGGGLSSDSGVFTAHDGTVWAVDADPVGVPSSSAVIKFDDRLGMQQRNAIVTIWQPVAVDGAWLDRDRLALVHDNFCSVAILDGSVARGLPTGMSNCAAILALDEQTVLVIGGSAEIKLVDLVTGRHADVVKFALRSSVFELATGPEDKIYLVSYFGPSAMDIAVVEIETRSSTTGFVNQAFTKADSGDLLGYAEQIRRVANRSVPLPVVVEPRLNALYNDALRKVREGLGNLIIDLIDDAGLQLISQNVPRQLDGWLPPEYGGGVIQPRWRLSNTYDGPWLEAAVGVSHRAWPTTNLNDLVITLIIAVMSDQAQHTLLTRFVPFELDDLSLRDKINALVVDVRAILPSAIEVLRNVSVNQPRRNR